MNNLKKLRKEKGLSQGEFAKTIRAAQSTVSNWEQGTRDIDSETLRVIADYFNVSVDYVLGRTDNPFPPDIKKVVSADKTPSEAAIEYFFAENGREPTPDELRSFLAVAKGLFSMLPKSGSQITASNAEVTKNLYRAARSENNAQHEVIPDTEGKIERFKKLRKVTSAEDL